MKSSKGLGSVWALPINDKKHLCIISPMFSINTAPYYPMWRELILPQSKPAHLGETLRQLSDIWGNFVGDNAMSDVSSPAWVYCLFPCQDRAFIAFGYLFVLPERFFIVLLGNAIIPDQQRSAYTLFWLKCGSLSVISSLLQVVTSFTNVLWAEKVGLALQNLCEITEGFFHPNRNSKD